MTRASWVRFPAVDDRVVGPVLGDQGTAVASDEEEIALLNQP
ncbi:hypothetical protein [Nocardia sp. NPDC052112]